MNADQTMSASKGGSTRRQLNAGHQASSRAGNGQWRVGEVVEGLYEVREENTAGAMGLVYRVHHQSWNIDLAVKTPRPELVSSPQRMSDFETEAQTWVELGLHPNVVACVYVRRIDELPRVFAEWVDGGSLHDAIASGRLYEGTAEEVIARILDVAIQFAWGLDYAHSQGLVHQDVKPRNVMVTADWTVKVTDFGLAKARAVAGESTVAGAGGSVLAGFSGFTPAYCSPEQATAAATVQTGGRPEPLTRATDVWSWAISVWETFTGSPPVDRGQAASEAFAAFREDSWVDDRRIPALPPGVAELLARCLDPDPTTRPRRMGRIADELADLYQQLAGIVYPRSRPDAAGLLADGLNNQALSMLDLGRIDEAERLWQQALGADPQHLDALYNSGLHQWRAGQITDADLIDRLVLVRASRPGADADRLLAHVHLERCDSVSASELLADALRAAPEDHALNAALHAAQRQPARTARNLTGHTSSVASVAVSADGRLAVSGGGYQDNTVRVWDLVVGTCAHALTGHTGWVVSVAVSGDGRLAISVGIGDTTVRVWDLAAGTCLRHLTGDTGGMNSVAVSTDGRLAISGSDDKAVRIWDVASGACLRTLTGHTAGVRSVAVSADGRLAVSGSTDGTVRIWDLGSGACLRTLTGHSDWVGSVAVSGDGRLAISSASDKTVRVWDLNTGTCVRTLTRRTESEFPVALSTDGRTAICGSDDKTVQVWDLQSGTCLRTLTGHTSPVRSVAVSTDGRVAISGGADKDKTVRVWDVPVARGQRAAWSYTPPRSAHDLLAVAAAVEIAVGRAQNLLAVADGAGAAAQLRTARAVEGYRRDPRLIDLWRQLAGMGTRGRLLDAWPQRELNGHTRRVDSVAVSADRRLAVSGSADGTVRVWDLGAGVSLRTLTGHTGKASAVAVSADGRLAVSGGGDKTVRVWDLGAGVSLRTLTGHTGAVSAVAVSADGRLAISGGSDKTLRVWDLNRGRCVRTLIGHTTWVVSVAVSADRRLAVSGSYDNTLRVWDLNRGRCVRTLTGHTNVVSVAMSAYRRLAVSGGGDKTVRVWDLRSGTCLRTLTGHTCEVFSVAVSADGGVAVSAGDDGTARVWALDWDYEFAADHSSAGTAKRQQTSSTRRWWKLKSKRWLGDRR